MKKYIMVIEIDVDEQDEANPEDWYWGMEYCPLGGYAKLLCIREVKEE